MCIPEIPHVYIGEIEVIQLLLRFYVGSYTPYLWWNYKKMSICKLKITYHNIGPTQNEHRIV